MSVGTGSQQDAVVLHPIVGVWRLRRYWTQYDEDSAQYPLGDDAIGYIMYTADGYLAGSMQRRGVEPFTLADRLQATQADKARAFDGYVTYCGRWYAAGERLFHKIELSLLPNWVGQTQERIAHWRGDDRVDLVAEWEVAGRLRRAVVEWERAR